MTHHQSASHRNDRVPADLSRRAVLAGAMSMGMLPAAIAATARRPRRVAGDDDVVDVLIVGAGVSGCYAACRLSQKSPGSRIELHERSDRIGGRLWSIKPEGMTRQVAELGGMRIANNQTPLLNLVSELGLSVDPYPATTPKDLYFLRGIRTRASKLVASPEFGYRVREDLRGKTLHELFRFVVKTATGQETWTRDEMRDAVASVRYRGRLLHEIPYEWLFNDILGHEGAAMLLAGMGYGRPNTNAAVFMKEAMLDLFVHGYSHVRGGYQQVPLKLADRARQQGVDIHFGHEMIDLRFEGDLTVVTFRTSDGETLIRKAKKVVTTLPMSAYQYLPDQCPLRGSNGLTAMESEMLPVPATKIYVNFPSQWWNGLGIKSGRSITDIPIRQVFYLDDPSGRGLSLSPYAAGVHDSDFWSPLLPTTGHRADGDTLAAVTIRRQLAQMHGIEIPKPSEILYRDFQGGKVGHGWNMWRPGVEPWKVAPAARQPIPGRDLYCVGQATSEIQGWVMETIETTESVLRSRFGLERPTWWPASYGVD